MSFDFGKECIDFIGCQSEAIKTRKESVYKKESELISYFLDQKEKDEQPKKLSKVINIIEDCIKTGHINFVTASMILLSRLTVPKDEKFKNKLIPPTINNLLEYITSKFKNINCVKYIVIILNGLYKDYPFAKNQIISIVLKYFTGEETNLIAYGVITHNNALKIISYIVDDIINGIIKFSNEEEEKFLSIVKDLIDETQDPRNLKLIFDFVPKLSLCINKNILEKYSKEIFECIFGFFPINFNSKDTKNVKAEEIVTEEELTKSLNNLLSQKIFNAYLFENIDPTDYKNSSDLLLLYQSVIQNYEYELLSKYYDNIIGYILTTLKDNNEEFLNIQCFITYKTFLEKYYPYDAKIESTWNQLYDNIFSDDTKTATIGKDMICPIITYDKQNIYIEKCIELFIKMISLYTFDLNKYILLKLSNSIIFFFLKKNNDEKYEDKYIKSLNILKDNKKLLLSIIKDKKYYSNNSLNDESALSNTNKFIIIADILTGIATKINKINIFENEEKKEIFEIIYDYYINNINVNNETEKDIEHLCILLVEICKNIEKNEFILYNKIKDVFLSKNKKSYHLIKQIYKLSEDNHLKKNIINDMIQNIENNEDTKDILMELLSYEKNLNNKENILKDFNNEFEKIITNHINEELFNDFINNVKDNLDIPNLIQIIQNIINILISSNKSKQLLEKLNNFINVLIKKGKESEIMISEIIEELFKKIKQLHDKYISEKINNEENNIIINCLKKLFKYCRIEFRKKIIDELISTKIEEKDEKQNKIYNNIDLESYISMIINYILKNNEKLVSEKIINNSYDDLLIQKIFKEIESMDLPNKRIFEKSHLFKIKNLPEKIIDKLLINLKKYYSSKSEENIHFLNLLMNIYNSLPFKEQTKNLDIIFTLNIECINKKINPIQSINNLRKLLISVNPKEIIKLSDLIKIYPLCKNIIEIIKDEKYNESKQAIKIEGIKLIGLLSGFIQDEDWETEDKKYIIFYLKKYFLNDKKRNVRYATGIILNLLNCSSPKISFYNQ